MKDKTAEDIWSKEGFELNGKSQSKYLAYHMGMRYRVFDDWILAEMKDKNGAVVIHIGCGLLLSALNSYFDRISLLMDCYTVFAA